MAFKNSNLETRHNFIRLLLQSCHNPDIALIYNFVSKAPSLKIDYLTELPQELSVYILAILASSDHPHSLYCVSLVSKRWKRLLDDQDFWRQACRFKGWIPVNSNKYLNNSQRILRQIIWSTPSFRQLRAPWKSTYIDHYLTERNWSIGKYKMERMKKYSVLDREQGDMSSFCINFDDVLEHAVYVTNNDRMQGILWNMTNGKVKSSFVGHEGPISAACIGKDICMSGGVDGLIRIWSITRGMCLKELVGHEGEINCIKFNEEIVLSGSQDRTLRVWSINDGECLKVLRGHCDAITCVQLNSEYISSGSADGTIIIWDRKTLEKRKETRLHQSTIYCMSLDEDYVITGSADHSIKVVSLNTCTVKRVLKGHSAAVVSVQSDKQRIVSGSSDHSIKVWSYRNGNLMYSLNDHKSPLWNIKFDKSRLISSSFDQTLLLYNFSGLRGLTGEERMKFGLVEDKEPGVEDDLDIDD